MKYLILTFFIAAISCKTKPETRVVYNESAGILIKYVDGSNYRVYKVKIDSSEYILLVGLNGNAITKHK